MVVTTLILVMVPALADMPYPVKRLVWSLLEDPVLLEELKLKSKNPINFEFNYIINLII